MKTFAQKTARGHEWCILDLKEVSSRIRESMEGKEWRQSTLKYGNPHRHLVQSKQRVLGAAAHRGCWIDLPKHSHLYTNMTIPVTKIYIKKIKIKRIQHLTALWFHTFYPKSAKKHCLTCADSHHGHLNLHLLLLSLGLQLWVRPASSLQSLRGRT